METLRKVNGFSLNVGTLQANGLYNISNEDCTLLSLWFDDETKNELMQMSDAEFTAVAECLVK
jgi:hypothetical protein